MISIHALRGEGDGNSDKLKCPTFISIHALRGEGDARPRGYDVGYRAISIHALRGEGDAKGLRPKQKRQ